MSGKLPKYGDFSIESSLIDEHEWITDYFIDGELGCQCTLIYPPTFTECPNCIFDQQTNESSSIYKAGGPMPFTNHTVCPWCGGVGKRTDNPTALIRLRVYWGGSEVNAAVKMFKTMGVTNINDQTGIIFVIGYMADLQNFQKADLIRVVSNLDIADYQYSKASEAVPWGFRHNRYFACMLSRH